MTGVFFAGGVAAVCSPCRDSFGLATPERPDVAPDRGTPDLGTWGEYRTIPFRYVWPSELDLMAQLAGLRLRDRWADWNREPFTTDSRSHVSVWQKPAPPQG
jgi:hypothetical protein